MKRQFPMGKSGFTLFELMVTVTVLLVFFVYTLQFNWNPRTDSEKSELISVGIAGRLRTEIQNISIGKMPKIDGTGRIAKATVITISTGSILTEYYSGTTLLNAKTYNSPYFEGDPKYVIKSITWTGSANSYVGTGKIIIEPSGITFSGSPSTSMNNTLLEIRVGYNLSTKKIIVDRRTGQISEKKQ